MLKLRNNIFETNSSSTHSVSIHMWDFCVSSNIEEDEVPNDIWLDSWDQSYILSNIPTDELEKELEARRNNNA